MTKDNMDVISITPGQTVKVEHYKLGDGGLEYNIQQEFDYRREALHAPQVINKAISSDGDWGLSGWTPGDSFEISVPAGDLWLKKGVADIGGRRFIRTGDGSIESEAGVRSGVTADGHYYIRIKYVISNDDHSYIAEATVSPDTNDDKYITLAYAEVDNWPTTPYNWVDLTDLRSSNTSLDPPVVFSGDTDGGAVAVLTITQTGSTEQSLEVYGGDSTFFTSGTPKKLIVYGNSTDAIEIHNAAVASGKLRAGAVADTLYVDKFDIATQLDVASMTLSTTDISGALTIGDLTTLTLATTGASIELTNASAQTLTLQNQGTGVLNVDIIGDLSPTTMTITGGGAISSDGTIGCTAITGTTITGTTITGTSTLQGTTINLTNAINQIALDSDGTTGTITMAALGAGRTWTLPNGSGTFIVGEASSALSVSAAGILTIEDPLTIANGGTSATTDSGARTALGLAIGSNVQAYDLNLNQIAALSPSNNYFMVGNGSAWTIEAPSAVRTSLVMDTNDAVVFGSLTCGVGQVKDVHSTMYSGACAFLHSTAIASQYMYGKTNYQYPYVIAGGFAKWGMGTAVDVGRTVVDVSWYYFNNAARSSSYYAVWGYFTNATWTNVSSVFYGGSWGTGGYSSNTMTMGSHAVLGNRQYYLLINSDIGAGGNLGLSGVRLYFDE